ncbi:hypothetical protein SYK_32100 [Pseudodesulfovibrio nedwellii]|uniref:DUF4365 domain-containing protein n=1 Tax=Pseudodesulfovibrio nedwellii TaxID=2973072 RepID=A0ABN6S6F1_9BACT|nr:DUF4365 domain-containing protein [Pseudodesulfovibrio nedwellii]BDQ38850.1 hypothetical protein SYK_32100 [Pseudodesulfovibrio nedwellii]
MNSLPPITDQIGVGKINAFFSINGWLFREQPVNDYGIDAHVEIVDEDGPTGLLIGIQIKTGNSFFEESHKDNYIFRFDSRHATYWTSHSLPVIIVMCHPSENILVWQIINSDTLISTGKGWKIHIPKSNLLSKEALKDLNELVQPPSYIRRLNRLRLDKKWMDLITEGETVYVEFEDWINKSLARFVFRIGCEGRPDVPELKWPMIYGSGSMERALQHVIPWAKFNLDEDSHREGAEAIWDAECYWGTDKETGTVHHTMPFDEWYTPPTEIMPCSEDGETASYRLLLSLNELGKAFSLIDEFLQEDAILLVEAR